MEYRLDDLEYKGLHIYQRTDLPAFTQDTVLLADFAALKPTDYAVDLGAGTGALAILIHARCSAKFCCVEKQMELAKIAQMSMAYNGLDIEVHVMDWADAPKALGHGRFSAAVCNPPYYSESAKSPDEARAQTRSGNNALYSVMQSAFALLKNGGMFYFCYPAAKLTEAFARLRETRLEPKVLRLAAQNAAAEPYLALIAAKKHGKPGMRVLPLLFLKDENGEDTLEFRRIYHMD